MKKSDLPVALIRSITHATITTKQERKNYRKSNINQEVIDKQKEEFFKCGGKIQYLPIGESGVEI